MVLIFWSNKSSSGVVFPTNDMHSNIIVIDLTNNTAVSVHVSQWLSFFSWNQWLRLFPCLFPPKANDIACRYWMLRVVSDFRSLFQSKLLSDKSVGYPWYKYHPPSPPSVHQEPPVKNPCTSDFFTCTSDFFPYTYKLCTSYQLPGDLHDCLGYCIKSFNQRIRTLYITHRETLYLTIFS